MIEKRLCATAFFSMALASSGAFAAEGEAAAPFKVVGTALHNDGARPEFCLALSAPLDIADKAQILDALDLRKDDKKIRVTAQDLSLTSTDICVQGLEFRRRYDLLLQRIEDLDGRKLQAPYDAAFVVSDRKPLLAFVTDTELQILPRHGKKTAGKVESKGPLLRSVNVERTHLTLYRFRKEEAWAGAWQRFAQNNLSPSESLTFAREEGEKIFETDLLFGANANVEQTLAAPLPSDAELTAGLYYLAAAPQKEGKDITQPDLFAGRWFLVSDLKLATFRLPGGVAVFTGSLATQGPAGGAQVQLLSRDGQILAETKTDAEGQGFLPWPEGKKGMAAALLLARAPTGEADLRDIGKDAAIFGALPVRASIQTDRQAYQPGSTAGVLLRAEDGEGHPLQLEGSRIKLRRAGGRVYNEQLVAEGSADAVPLNIPLPVTGEAEDWSLVWEKGDGTFLAEKKIRLVADAAPVSFKASFARLAPGESGGQLALEVSDGKGKALSFREGTLSVRPLGPEIPAWKGYRFGTLPPLEDRAAREVKFMTGPEGVARVSLSFMEEDLAQAEALEVTAWLHERGAPETLAVPLRRAPFLVGVRARTDGQAFAENGVARFDVLAVDETGRRVFRAGLDYLIFEEGRRFAWFPAEGHWDYKPLPQRRRIGGGALSIAASGETVIAAPVTSGQYILEILDAQGKVLARRFFEAGRVAPKKAQVETPRFALLNPPDVAEEKKEEKIAFRLETPAYVTGLVYDGRLRTRFAKFFPQGTHTFSFTPDGAWGGRAALRLQAQFADRGAPVSLEHKVEIRHPRRELAINVAPPAFLTTGGGFALPVRIQKIQGRQPTFVSVLATPLSDDASTDWPLARVDRLPVGSDGKALLRLNLPVFTGNIRLQIVASNSEQFARKVVSIPARPSIALWGNVPAGLGVGEKAEVAFGAVNNAAPEGVYNYSFALPDGVQAEGASKGTLSLKKGKAQTLSLTLIGKENGAGDVRLILKGASGEGVGQTWPLAVTSEEETKWRAAAQKIDPGHELVFPLSGDVAQESVGLLAPMELPVGLASWLGAFVRSEPMTSEEIALWLRAAQVWERTIVALDLFDEAGLGARRDALIETLLARQNDDGGFAAIVSGDPSDMASTAAASLALAGSATRPAALAAGWLEQKLQNTWFAEEERAARAMAFGALAFADRSDLSALRYFAQTSKDKNLPPRAAATIAFALARGGDGDAARLWADRARAALFSSGEEEGRWAALDLLVEGGLVPADAFPALLADMLEKTPPRTVEQEAHRLVALAEALAAKGSWSVRAEGMELKNTGVMILDPPHEREGGGPRRLDSTRTMYLLTLDPVEAKEREAGSKGRNGPPPIAVQREFLKLNGEDLSFDTSLMTSESYLLVLRGNEKKPRRLRLFVPSSAAFDLLVPRQAQALHAMFPWLAEPSRLQAHTRLPTGDGLVFDAQGSWRIVLVVKPTRRGAYALPKVRVLTEEGEELDVTQNALPFSVW